MNSTVEEAPCCRQGSMLVEVVGDTNQPLVLEGVGIQTQVEERTLMRYLLEQ